MTDRISSGLAERKLDAMLVSGAPNVRYLSGFTGEAESLLRFDLYVQGFNFTNADNAQYQIAGSNNGNLQGRVTDRMSQLLLNAIFS